MTQKKIVSAIVLLMASTALPAAAEFSFDNNSGGTVRLYGQFNPAYLSFDDGQSTTSEIVDNTNSNSRVGLDWRQGYGENTFRFNFETALGFRPSAGMSQTNTPKGVDWQRTSIRKVDFSLMMPMYGTFYAGQGSMATDGVAHNDFSGTTLVTYASVSDTAGGFEFRTGAGALSGIHIGSVFRDLDGGRRGRVRYDTPSFGGFTVSAAWGKNILVSGVDDEYYDVSMRYANDFGDLKVRGAIGYAVRDRAGASDIEHTIGSVSLLHASGFNLTLAAGNQDGDATYGYGKLGYIGNWLALGSTAMSVDYYEGNDFSSQGVTSSSVGFGVVQKFDNANVEAYLGYRTYELSDAIDSYKDASSILFGARLKF